MKKPDELQAYLRVFLSVGLMMVGCSVFLVLSTPSDSPEYVLSVCNIGIGAVLVLGVVVFLRVFCQDE